MIHKAVADDDRERFPALVESIGEDPARFLDKSGPEYDKNALIAARIRGIDSIEVLRAWRAVERRLHGGRSAVVELLDEREAYLEEHGERTILSPEELERRHEASLEADDEEEPDPVYRHEKCGETDVERESSRTWFCHTCEQRTNRVEEVDPDDVDVDDRQEAAA